MKCERPIERLPETDSTDLEVQHIAKEPLRNVQRAGDGTHVSSIPGSGKAQSTQPKGKEPLRDLTATSERAPSETAREPLKQDASVREQSTVERPPGILHKPLMAQKQYKIEETYKPRQPDDREPSHARLLPEKSTYLQGGSIQDKVPALTPLQLSSSDKAIFPDLPDQSGRAPIVSGNTPEHLVMRGGTKQYSGLPSRRSKSAAPVEKGQPSKGLDVPGRRSKNLDYEDWKIYLINGNPGYKYPYEETKFSMCRICQ